MDVTHFFGRLKKTKLHLVFFCLILVGACESGGTVTIEQVDYVNQKAVGVKFSTVMDVEKLRVFIGEESQTSVIGAIVSEEDKHIFTPIIPFTPGQQYTLRKSDTVILASFEIRERTKTDVAELIAIYPQADTVPENLLKMYFEFARPMQQVTNALDFITVTDDTNDLVIEPFLRLESELWNKERTLLTLWLDPGRIKTDLIPNKQRGLPLNAGNEYTLTIDPKWKSVDGSPLTERYRKKFYVGPRDNKMPNSKKWQPRIRDEGSVKSLYLDFGESMDAFLAKETIRIYDSYDTQVIGKFNLLDNETLLRFVPDKAWPTDEIEIRIESRLEDLAGNSLNRLFDTDLKKDPKQRKPKPFFSIPFEIR